MNADFSKGVIPVIVQDFNSGDVLMLGYADEIAYELTITTGFVHFYSRSRKTLWKKGETSGNVLVVKELYLDCDGDTMLVKAIPAGPTCHTGSRTCFFTKII